MNKFIERAIAIKGSQAKLAAAIGKTQPCVYYHLHKKGKISKHLVIPIEKATKREVTRYEMRPDIWPGPSVRNSFDGVGAAVESVASKAPITKRKTRSKVKAKQ